MSKNLGLLIRSLSWLLWLSLPLIKRRPARNGVSDGSGVVRMNSPLVSFVLPSYKTKKEYLVKSLSSILLQTYENIEVIIILDTVDNKKDLETYNIIESFKDPRIRLFVRNGKRGYCSAINFGIRHSLGQYIAHLDSDDYCAPNRIEKQINLIKDKNAVLVGTWCIVVDTNNEKIGELRSPASSQSIRSRVMLHTPFHHSSFLFEKRMAKEIGLYNALYEGAEDYEFCLRVIAKGYSCACVPEFLAYVRQTPNSIMTGKGWMKTRKSYFMAKCNAVTKLGYTQAWDLIYVIGTLFAFFITPKTSSAARKIIGFYKRAR
jgi:glycosyltransferase involved in cell wall biosynthesis